MWLILPNFNLAFSSKLSFRSEYFSQFVKKNKYFVYFHFHAGTLSYIGTISNDEETCTEYSTVNEDVTRYHTLRTTQKLSFFLYSLGHVSHVSWITLNNRLNVASELSWDLDLCHGGEKSNDEIWRNLLQHLISAKIYSLIHFYFSHTTKQPKNIAGTFSPIKSFK